MLLLSLGFVVELFNDDVEGAFMPLWIGFFVYWLQRQIQNHFQAGTRCFFNCYLPKNPSACEDLLQCLRSKRDWMEQMDGRAREFNQSLCSKSASGVEVSKHFFSLMLFS